MASGVENNSADKTIGAVSYDAVVEEKKEEVIEGSGGGKRLMSGRISPGESSSSTGSDEIPDYTLKVIEGWKEHILTVNSGADIMGAIRDIARGGPYGICILSVRGRVSDALLSDPDPTSGCFTIKDSDYRIVSLTGTYLLEGSGCITIILEDTYKSILAGTVSGELRALGVVEIECATFAPFAPEQPEVPKKPEEDCDQGEETRE